MNKPTAAEPEAQEPLSREEAQTDLPDGQNPEVTRLKQQLSWARQQVRDLERQADWSRWSTLRARLFRRLASPARLLRRSLLRRPPAPRPGDPGGLPKISLVLTVLNSAHRLRRTLDSIVSQNYPALECIVVDGGSTDGSVEIIREYSGLLTAFIFEPDQGVYDAIGKGFDEATGDILGYLAAGDIYLPEALARVGAAFRADPRAQVVVFDGVSEIDGWWFPNEPERRIDFISLAAGRTLQQVNVFFSRRAYNYVGGINRAMTFAGDWELWVRLSYWFKFKRADGHVGVLHLRRRRLPADMQGYQAEIDAARKALRTSIRRVEFWIRRVLHWCGRLAGGTPTLPFCMMGGPRLFFPARHAERNPPPGLIHDAAAGQPVGGQGRCPVNYSPPTHFLFSSLDKRLGDGVVRYAYYHRDAHAASISHSSFRTLADTRRKGIEDQEIDRSSVPRDGSYQDQSWLLHRLSRFPRRVSKLAARRLGGSPAGFEASIRTLLPRDVQRPRLLDIGCGEGGLLDHLAMTGRWTTYGIEPNSSAAQTARSKGHEIWVADLTDALRAIPCQSRFDVICLSEDIGDFDDPLAMLVQLSQLLEAHGLLILSTPNLDSAQLSLLGQAWPHWHSADRRHLFSPKSIRLLAQRAQMRLLRCRTWPQLGWWKKGDYIHAVLTKDLEAS